MDNLNEVIRQATQPAPEYCLLWIDWWVTCMTKSEWASWSQAIGAIVGLWIALSIAWKSRKDVKRDAYWDLRYTAVQIASSYQLIIDACKSQDERSLLISRQVLVQISNRLAQSPVALMHIDLVSIFAMLRLSLANFLHVVGERGPRNWDGISRFAGELLKNTTGAFPVIDSHQPGTWANLKRNLRSKK